MRTALSLVPMLLLAAQAHAQTVDQKGADALQGSISRYVSKAVFDKGIVKVSPDGDAYRLVVDLEAFVPLLPKELEASLDAEPYVLRLKPGEGDNFVVTGPYLPKAAGEFLTPATGETPAMRTQFEFGVRKGEFTGTFDPALGTFSNAQISHGRISFALDDEMQSVGASASDGTTDFWASPSKGKGIDFAASQTVKNFLETVVVKSADGAAAGPITIAATSFDYDTDVTNFQNKQLLALAAFFVEQAGEKDISAKQPELKTLLRAALPLWDRLRGGYALSNLFIGTPVGVFRAESFGTQSILDGIGKKGSIDYSFDLKGLSVPTGAAPTWATALIPTDVSLKLGVRELDTEAPARQLIDAFDVSATPPVPDEVGQRIAADFMAHPPHVVVERSAVRNEDIEIAFSGEARFPGGKPEASAKVEVSGYDKAVAALQEAATEDPSLQMVFATALAAKGLAKTESDGRQVWAIEYRKDGSLLVNGSTLKGPDPASGEVDAPEAPEAPETTP